MKKKILKKSRINKVLVKINDWDDNSIVNYKKLLSIVYIIKKILPNRNYFYWAIPYYNRENEEDFMEFRDLITLYVE